jgi:hypothetical protein
VPNLARCTVAGVVTPRAHAPIAAGRALPVGGVAPREDVEKRYITALSSRPAYPWLFHHGLADHFQAASAARFDPLKPANPVADCSHRPAAPSCLSPAATMASITAMGMRSDVSPSSPDMILSTLGS